MGQAWKYLCASEIGTSHSKRGDRCQDNSLARELIVGNDRWLIVACSDGAGSCPLSHEGSLLACEAFTAASSEYLRIGKLQDGISQEVFLSWVTEARQRVLREAAARNVPPRDFSCTLLVALIGENCAWFGQIGDGVIVLRKGDSLEPVFWPQSGEYVNTTNFLTSDDFEQRFVNSCQPVAIDELAILTDGLQPLALHYASKSVHEPFFEPMFVSLRDWDSCTDLAGALRRFLASDRVNERTDDDKTLVLASRRSTNQ